MFDNWPQFNLLTWDTLESTMQLSVKIKRLKKVRYDASLYKQCPHFSSFLKSNSPPKIFSWEILDKKSNRTKGWMKNGLWKKVAPLVKIKICLERYEYMTYVLWLRCDKGWIDSDNYKFFSSSAACPLCIMSCQVALPRSDRAANQRDIQSEIPPCKNFPTLLTAEPKYKI